MSPAGVATDTGWLPLGPLGHAAATLVRPERTNGPAVVVVGSFGMESLAGARALDALAAKLASAGCTVVAVTPPGLGDAPDAAPETSLVPGWIRSVHAAIDLARRAAGTSRASVIGLRVGASIAAVAASTRDDLDHVVLWAPVAGRAFVREQRLMAATAVQGSAPRDDGGIEVGGFLLDAATASDLAALDPAALDPAALDPAALDPAAPGKTGSEPGPGARATARYLVIDRDDVGAATPVAGGLARHGASVELVTWPGFAALHLEDPELGDIPHETIARIASVVSAEPPAHGACAPPTAPPVLAREIRAEGWIERSVAVAMRDGRTIHGIVSAPSDDAANGPGPATGGVVAILLPTGRNPACGPGRLHAELARHWARSGVTTLRVERRGVGRSGHGDADTTLSAYDLQQVDDAVDLGAWVRSELHATAVAMIGICSGAYAAMHAPRRGASPDTVVAINQMIFDTFDVSDTGDTAALAIKARYDLRDALRSPRRWLDLLCGRVDLMRALGRLRGYLAIRLGRRAIVALDAGTDPMAPPDLATLLHDRAAMGIRQCFVFDVGDPGLAYLRFRAGGAVTELQRRGCLRLETVQGAGHTFAPLQSRAWLRDRLGEELALLGTRAAADVSAARARP